MIKHIVKAGQVALKVRKMVTTVTKPAQTIRDKARELAVKTVISVIVAAVGKTVSKDKIEGVINWETNLSFSIPVDTKISKWLADAETHTTLVDLINQGLQVPLALYGVTPAQLEVKSVDDKHLQVAVKLKVHKNSELK